MANNEMRIKIKIDGDTHEMTAVRDEVNQLGRSLSNTDTTLNTLRGTFGRVAIAAGGIMGIGAIFKQILTSGLETNRVFQNLQIQLTGLIAANSSGTDSFGKALSVHQKYSLAMDESEKILKKLNQTNEKTKFSLREIADSFNMFYATSAGQNGGRDKAVQAMDSIALAVQATGKDLKTLTPMFDSLSTGTVIAASEMGSFMKIVGLTNEELKKAYKNGNVYDHIIERLAVFKDMSKEAGFGFEVSLGNLKNELDELSRMFSKTAFDFMTKGIGLVGEFLKGARSEIVYFAENFNGILKLFAYSGAVFLAQKVLMTGYAYVVSVATLSLVSFSSSLAFSLTLANLSKKGILALSGALSVAGKAFLVLFPAALILGATSFFEVMEKINNTTNKNKIEIEDYKIIATEAFLDLGRIGELSGLGVMKVGVAIGQFFVGITKVAVSGVDLTINYIIDKINFLISKVTDFSNFVSSKLGLDPVGARKLEKINITDTLGMDKAYKKLNLLQSDISASIEATFKEIAINTTRAKIDAHNLGVKIQKSSQLTDDPNAKAIKDMKETNEEYKELIKTRRDLELLYLKHIGDNHALSAAQREEYENRVLKAYKRNTSEYKRLMQGYDESIIKQKERLKDSEFLKYYEALGEKQEAWAIKEKQIQEEMKKHGFFNHKEIKKYTEAEKKKYLQVANSAKKSFKEIASYWDGVTSSMRQSFEDNFFKALTGKFRNFKSFLSQFGKDIFSNLYNPVARNLSRGLSTSLAGVLGFPMGGLSKNLTNAGFSLVGDQWIKGDEKNPDAIITTAGEIIKGKDSLSSDLVSNLGNFKAAYDIFKGGLTNYIGGVTGYFTQAGGYLQSLGLGSTGAFVGGIGGGIGNLFGVSQVPAGMAGTGITSGMGGAYIGAGTDFAVMSSSPFYTVGSALAGAAIGGGVGYGLGWGLDKLTNSTTYAPETGALAGAALGGYGAIYGVSAIPVYGWVAGIAALILGGIFGKTKIKETGIYVKDHINAEMELSDKNIGSYVKKQKKSWFSKKTWDTQSKLDDETLKSIKGQISSLSSLVKEAGALKKFTLWKGQFSGKEFWDVMLPKAIITSMSNFPHFIEQETRVWKSSFQAIATKSIKESVVNPKFNEIYQVWSSYAKNINKTVLEAMVESLGKLLETKRSFEEWTLKDDPIKLAKYKADNAKKDLEAMYASMGLKAGEITKENFISKIDEATRNSFVPETINNWAKLKAAFINLNNASTAYTNSLIQSAQNLYNAQASLYNAAGIDSFDLRVRAKEEAILAYVKNNATNKDLFKDADHNIVKKWNEKLSTKAGIDNYYSSVINAEFSSKFGQLMSEYKNLLGSKKNIPRANNINYNPSSTKSIRLFVSELEILIKALSHGVGVFKNSSNTAKRVIDNLHKEDSGFIKEQYKMHMRKIDKWTAELLKSPLKAEALKGFEDNVHSASEYVEKYLSPKNFKNEWDYRIALGKARNDWREIHKRASVEENMQKLLLELKALRASAQSQKEIDSSIATASKRLTAIMESVERGNTTLKVSNG